MVTVEVARSEEEIHEALFLSGLFFFSFFGRKVVPRGFPLLARGDALAD